MISDKRSGGRASDAVDNIEMCLPALNRALNASYRKELACMRSRAARTCMFGAVMHIYHLRTRREGAAKPFSKFE